MAEEKHTEEISIKPVETDWVMGREDISPEDSEKLYQDWLKSKQSKKSIKKLAPPTGYDACSCVSYARWRSGINVGSIGQAKNHPINSQTPTVGALVITSESEAGHLAVVSALDDMFIYLDEANYSSCRVTISRPLLRTSSLIKGYYQ